jgi:hypothetical protein
MYNLGIYRNPISNLLLVFPISALAYRRRLHYSYGELIQPSFVRYASLNAAAPPSDPHEPIENVPSEGKLEHQRRPVTSLASSILEASSHQLSQLIFNLSSPLVRKLSRCLH